MSTDDLTRQERLLRAARAAAPAIAAGAPEADAARQLTASTVTALQEAGAFRMAMPQQWGGEAADPITQILVIEEVSAADGAAGWCVMIGCDGGYHTGHLDQAVGRSMYPDVDVATAGVSWPLAPMREVAGGYVVSGRWPFASGVTHAQWIALGCADPSGGGLRFVMAPVSAVEVLDTWQTTGMRGSGSHDVQVQELFVPRDRTYARAEMSAQLRPGPLYGWWGWMLVKHLGVPLGIGRGALAEAIALAGESRRLAQRPGAHLAMGEAKATLEAARAFALSSVATAWGEACAAPAGDGTPVSRAARLGMRLAITFAHEACERVVDAMYRSAGGAAVYTERGALDRRRRDMHTMNQHAVVSRENYGPAGRVLLGLPPEAPNWW